ncbi:hypothetical protein Fmac_021591 [Flemingia macrophylla]|uniref:Dynamin N-terminal domain-containing protein n=1 Tax=Flemingia macrophylla TaxID=520843 RepID=A0ABD1LXE2_9FABA
MGEPPQSLRPMPRYPTHRYTPQTPVSCTVIHHTCPHNEYLHLSPSPTAERLRAECFKKEISDETDRITGKTKAISNVPIQLSIYSPHVVNLTLIDLPGLTKVVVEGQSETIVQDIENMVCSYIEKANDSSSVPNTPLEGRHSSEASNP